MCKRCDQLQILERSVPAEQRDDLGNLCTLAAQNMGVNELMASRIIDMLIVDALQTSKRYLVPPRIYRH